MTRGKERDPRSEASQRRAFRGVFQNMNGFYVLCDRTQKTIEVRVTNLATGRTEAIFDLRDCFRKREPLTGVKKKLGDIVRGRK